MAVIYDKHLGSKPVAQALNAERYWSRKFTYPRIWQYHIAEKSILRDLDKIPVGRVDFSKRVTVLFHFNPLGKIVTGQILEWVMTQIGARLILSEEIVWSTVESPSLSKYKFEISIHVPVWQF